MQSGDDCARFVIYKVRIPREGERVARPGADLYAVLGISTSVGLAVVGWETNMRLKSSLMLVATE